MNNHWTIAIGINQYEFFQPLRYAQADAEALRNFLVGEAGCPNNCCLLLTDTSPPIRGQSTYPNQDNIQTWLEELCQNYVQPGDSLWFFFSGYGISSNGKDYLMPREGDPTRISETGIAIKTLFEQLKAAPSDDVFAILDMNRSQGSHWGAVTGAQTVELAEKMQVAALLSSQLDGFSHETSALQHGFFTAALLESLRYHQCITLETLQHYLASRVPELSTHHSRPEQKPLLIAYPPEKLQQIVFSHNGSFNTLTPDNVDADDADASQAEDPDLSVDGAVDGAVDGDNVAVSISDHEVDEGGQDAIATTEANDEDLLPSQPERDPTATEETALLPRLFWSGLIAGGLFLTAVVVWRHFKPFFGGAEIPAESSIPASPGATSDPALSQMDPANSSSASDPQPPASSGAAPAASDPQPPASSGAAPAPAASDPQPPTSSGAAPAPAASDPQPPTSSGAAPAPPEIAPSETVSPETSQANASGNSTAQSNNEGSAQALLDSAKAAIRPTQASYYSQAIFQASRIGPDDPLYETAQADIKRWSQVIFDIAQGRAQQGNLLGAIAAAKLIPQNQPIAADVQQSLALWKQQAKQQAINRRHLQEARQIVQRYQASSYNRAIAIAKKIQPGQPEYDTAQRLIAQWSKSIYELARSRASQGKLQSAIQTAKLVPPDTHSYVAAQNVMSKWRTQLDGS